MIETSQEGAIAVLIHEILHTYIAESNLLDRRLDLIDNNLHHQIFADKYITPMTTFLQQQFVSLPTLDAYALAWSGLGNLSSHEVVTIEGVSYSRSELGSISAMYYGKFNGQHLAGTDKCIN